MRYARGLDEGRIEAQHAASLRSGLATLREQDGRGAGRSDPRRAAGRGRKAPTAIPKKIGAGVADREIAPERNADLADTIPDLMVWNGSRHHFLMHTRQLG